MLIIRRDTRQAYRHFLEQNTHYLQNNQITCYNKSNIKIQQLYKITYTVIYTVSLGVYVRVYISVSASLYIYLSLLVCICVLACV